MKIEVHSVRLQLLVDFVFVEGSVKPTKTAWKDIQSYVGLGVLNVIIPDKKVFAICVLIGTRMRSIFFFGCILVSDGQSCFSDRVERVKQLNSGGVFA